MPYATQAQIALACGGNDRLTQLADWNGDGNIAAVIAESQVRADGWIDSFLRLRYATPIAAPSDTLIRLAADECVYWIKSARDMLALTPQDIDKRKERERELADLRDGKLRLDEPMPTKSTAVVATVVENCDSISRAGLKGSVW